MNDEHPRDSQQEPQHDSALQTPQPDQAHPPVSDQSATEEPQVDVDVEVNVDDSSPSK
jgi:hypothetical protein